LINTSKSELLEQKDFIDGASKLFNSSFDENLEFIFSLMDFDGDGMITPEDIRLVLSHVPLAQILQDKHSDKNKEGQYTASGGGL
jgi:Ca2+-binding EF-hand superfamily protein